MKTDPTHCAAKSSPRVLSAGLVLCLGFVPLFTLGCNNGKVAKANDELRAKNMQLESDVDELRKRLSLREEELKATRKQLDDKGEPINGVEPPRLAGIVLGRYSGPIDLDGDAVFDELRVYVRPVDQNSRQVTAEGTARIRLITAEPEGEPKAIVDKRYSVKEFHAAYRDGITGTHYTLGAELPKDRPAKATLLVTLTDATTGRAFTVQRIVKLAQTASK